MAQIVINEVSSNYNYSVNTASYATVAMPITAAWGPCFMDPTTVGKTQDEMLELTQFQLFPATQAGLDSFISTYRGPESIYRLAGDYSYQQALTLLTSGYNVLVCRLCPGVCAEGKFTDNSEGEAEFVVKAKYPGTFGNNLQVVLTKVANRDYWNIITYVVDSTGVRTAVENLIFRFEQTEKDDNILTLDELESNFLSFAATKCTDKTVFKESNIKLSKGSDQLPSTDKDTALEAIKTWATKRYTEVGVTSCEYTKSIETYVGEGNKEDVDELTAKVQAHNEWVWTNTYYVLELLKDKLSYNPNRIIVSGWDDQNLSLYKAEPYTIDAVSPLHVKLLNVAYFSRCATSYIDIPKCCARSRVWDEDASNEGQKLGYAQKISRYLPADAVTNSDINTGLYTSHSALFAPWTQYTYVGTSKMSEASPSFAALMLERAMILNQPIQYEWALPTNRRHNLNFGKFAYNIPKKLLDQWQNIEGVGVNIITNLPDLGTTLWGNSTLFETPPATYQALANLSTRKLVNAVEDIVYRCGISITFQYNNDSAYSAFYAGVTPTLDVMKNAGAIVDYRVQMSADINGVDHVNANTVIGFIYLTVNGVINNIVVDLVALPSNVDLDSYIG